MVDDEGAMLWEMFVEEVALAEQVKVILFLTVLSHWP